MHSRRAFITAGLAAVALAAVAIPDRALATAGLDLNPQRTTRIVTIYRSTPNGLEYVGEMQAAQDMVLSPGHDRATLVVDETDRYTTGDRDPIFLKAGEVYQIMPSPKGGAISFVDGVFLVPGGEQLRVFYRDKVYAPKGTDRTAAMQPDNGAGQVSGDRAQSVGKAGDLKAARPGGVQSGTPGAKAVDARKQSWIGRAFRRFVSPTYS